jgi:hypothetical protein
MRRFGRGAALIAVPLFLSACAPPWERVSPLPPGRAQIAVRLPQGGKYDCGPEALGAVFALGGLEVPVADISKVICEPKKGGTNVVAMSLYAASKKFWSMYAPHAGLELIEAALDRGIPPVVMVQILPSRFHYFLVTGLSQGDIVCADYGDGGFLIPEDKFLAMWDGADRMTLLIAPDLREFQKCDAWHRYLDSLEDSPIPWGPFDAQFHYGWADTFNKWKHPKLAIIEAERAIRKSKRRMLKAVILLGEIHYKQGDYEAAAEALERGAWGGGDCANNLGFILAEHLGRPADGLRWAETARAQAVQGSGAWLQSWDTAGLALFKLGRLEEAEKSWSLGAEAAEGKANAPIRAACWAGAAKAAFASGRPEDGEVYLRKALLAGLPAAEADAIRPPK